MKNMIMNTLGGFLIPTLAILPIAGAQSSLSITSGDGKASISLALDDAALELWLVVFSVLIFGSIICWVMTSD